MGNLYIIGIAGLGCGWLGMSTTQWLWQWQIDGGEVAPGPCLGHGEVGHTQKNGIPFLKHKQHISSLYLVSMFGRENSHSNTYLQYTPHVVRTPPLSNRFDCITDSSL